MLAPLTPFDTLRVSGKRGPLIVNQPGLPFVVSQSNHLSGDLADVAFHGFVAFFFTDSLASL